MTKLKDIFNWNNPQLFERDSVIRRSFVFAIVIISNILIAFETFGVLISDDILQGYYAIDDNRKVWVGLIFLVGIAMVTPIFSVFTSNFTAKVYFSIGLAIFMVGSLLAGLCTNYYLLIFFRVITGFGAGVVACGSITILRRVAHTSLHGFTSSLNTNLFGLGITFGMIIGGIIGQSLHWRLAFFLDVFLCIFDFLLIWIMFKQRYEFTPKLATDWIAYIYFLGFITSLVVFFTQVKAPWNTLGWRSDFSHAFALSAIIFVILLVRKCCKSSNPLFNVSLFKNRSVTLLCFASFLVGFTLFGCLLNYIFLLIGYFEYEHITTGLVLCVYGASLFLTGMGAFFMKNVKPVFFVLAGLLCIAVSFFLNHAVTIQSEPKDILLLHILRGMGTGLCLQPITDLLNSRVAEEDGPDALKLILVFRQLAGFITSPIIMTVTTMRQAYHSLRFGEEVDIYSGRFKYYVRQFQLHAERATSKNWEEAVKRTKEYIISNIQDQAHVAAFNDALFVFAWACVVVALLIGLNEALIYVQEREVLKEQ